MLAGMSKTEDLLRGSCEDSLRSLLARDADSEFTRGRASAYLATASRRNPRYGKPPSPGEWLKVIRQMLRAGELTEDDWLYLRLP